MRILVTGGAGYIGSHTVLKLINAGYDTLIVDNFVSSSPDCIRGLEAISGARISFELCDLRDADGLNAIFRRFMPDMVMHFAGLKSVSESIANPLEYYDVNVLGTLNLLRAMTGSGCAHIVFSSSATVYGANPDLPYTEQHTTVPMNAYGSTKLCCEKLIDDWAVSSEEHSSIILRYFNPVGAHESGLIGESPNGTPNNLMPYVCNVAIGKLPRLTIHGKDFNTKDGTGERDFIHVEDLAEAHVCALQQAFASSGSEIYNVGTGRAHSVLDVVDAFEFINSVAVPYEFGPRRPGDASRSVASVEKIEKMLGWKARLSLNDMCESAWRWQMNQRRDDS